MKSKLSALTFALLAIQAVAPPPPREGSTTDESDLSVYDTDYAQLGQPCNLYYNSKKMSYKPETGKKPEDLRLTCRPDELEGGQFLACQAGDNDSGAEDASGPSLVPGVCQYSKCGGLDDTDGVNSKNLPKGETSSTKKVTICHRTCSKTNPWVRLTIDSDAWEKGDDVCGAGNGHPEHSVLTCGVSDTTPWGSQTSDYLIKTHGTRASVAQGIASGTITGYADEDEYWSSWEPACPYVRMTKPKSCCDPTKGSCCGDLNSEPEPQRTTRSPPPSGSRGDPHFKSWNNEHFEYHGQCDLVLAVDTTFADGLGLDVHIRTKLVRFWSYIKQAAVRIGADILEIEGSVEGPARYWLNFEKEVELKTVGGFPVSFEQRGGTKFTYTIDLSSKYPGQSITISTFKEFVSVDFSNGSEEAFGNCVGLLGDHKTGKTVARDGVSQIDDFIELGHEWQVLPAEPTLFHDTSEPQFPKKCIEPEDPRGERRRRLGETTISEEQAEKACSGLKDALDRKDCVYDILATQDLDMVGAY